MESNHRIPVILFSNADLRHLVIDPATSDAFLANPSQCLAVGRFYLRTVGFKQSVYRPILIIIALINVDLHTR